LEFQLLELVSDWSAYYAFQGFLRIQLKIEQEFRVGEILIQPERKIAAAGNALIHEGRKDIAITDDEFSARSAFDYAVFGE
jgi:hypothetical protein